MEERAESIADREQESAKAVGDAIRASVPYRYRTLLWSLLIGTCVIATIARWIHVAADVAWGAEEPAITFYSARYLTMIARCTTLAGYPIAMFLVLGHMSALLGAWKRYLSLWMIAAALWMVVFTIFRDWIAINLTDFELKYYPFNVPEDWRGGPFTDWDVWYWKWSWGLICLTEFGYVLLMGILPIAFVAYVRLVPGTGLVWFYAIVICVAGFIVTVAYPFLTGLIVWDYDTFLGGTFVDSLSFQAMSIYYAGDPVENIALPVNILFFGATYISFRSFEKDDAADA